MQTKLTGVVTSDRNSKTRRVDVERLFQHGKYKKIVRGRTVCYVHDENNDSKIGDTVEIVECRPHSKTKRWKLVRVVNSSDNVASQLLREEQSEDAKTVSDEVNEMTATEESAPAEDSSTEEETSTDE